MQNYFKKLTFLTLVTFILASYSLAQPKNFPAPREEVLLNGLRVLIWSQPNTGRVEVKLRVHSGAAFDPQDKAGTTALLSEILFPEEGIREYFEDDLEGKLEMTTTHDFVQIDTTSKASEFVALMETLSSSVTTPQIDKETLAKVKKPHLVKLQELENDPSYTVNQGVATRLYGDYPYGRPVLGTTESVSRVDFADLIFSRQRFLTADNATLTIVGDVKSDYAYKAARRLFGGWQKSLNRVPANFRIPEKPSTAPLELNVDDSDIFAERLALETFSRRDKNYPALLVVSEILDKRYKEASAQPGLKAAFVKNNSNYLRGYLIFAKDINIKELPIVDITGGAGSETELDSAADTKSEQSEKQKWIKDLFERKISQGEFTSAKAKVLASLNKTEPADMWLNMHTYRLDSVKNEFKKIDSVSLGDVQSVASQLSKNTLVEVAIVSVTTELKGGGAKEDVSIPADINKDPKDPF